MKPYVAAQKEALLQGLFLLDGVVLQPIGLTYDLRSMREALLPQGETSGEEESPVRRERPTITLEQGLGALLLTQHTLQVLSSLGALDPAWTNRAQMVLGRVERQLGQRFREEQARRVRGLYVIVDPAAAKGRDPVDIADAALAGGARVIQLRDKIRDTGEQLPIAQRLATLCEQRGALFIMNDHADLASACGAHGLHVGQHDLPIEKGRRLLGPRQLIGRSNATVDEALASQSQGADYVAIGAIYSTETKEKTRPAGLETLQRVKSNVQTPVVAVGGINAANVEAVVVAGADAAAVISAVVGADDPRSAAAQLAEKIENFLAKRSR